MSPNRYPDLICPRDKTPLVEGSGEFRCAQCGRSYPVIGAVASFLEQGDLFYEGTYQNRTNFIPRNEKPWYVWPLWLINSGWVWCVRKHVPVGAVIVELGCARGVAYFGRRYRMIGVDVSQASLDGAAELYEVCLKADAAACIPLPDHSVDAVVSSYFWEHIPPTLKPGVLAECRRILRPDGKIIFLYDVETDNPLIRRYKRKNRALYDRLFIEDDGHLGYQRPRDNLVLFRESGFRVLIHKGMEKTWLQSPSSYTKLSQFSIPGQRWFGWTKILNRHPWFYFYTGLIRMVDATVCPWLPQDWARIDMVVSEKEA